MPEVTRIIALRHGQTAWNVESRIQGQLDVELDDTGRRQAERAAAALSHETLAAVYSSDLRRAHDTARSLARLAGVPTGLEPGLRERRFGIFEGYTFREIEARWPEQSERWRRRDPSFGPEGGETLADFYARSVETATRLAARHRGQTIALVSHGGVLDCLYRAAARIELGAPRTWQLANTGINRLLHTGQGLMLVGWNDVSHLEEVPPAASAVEAGPASNG